MGQFWFHAGRPGIGGQSPQIFQKPGHPDDLLDMRGREAVHARSIRAMVATTHSNATNNIAGSHTKLNRSPKLRPGSAAAPP